MGTRGLTKVIDSNGVTKIAQYGQWDHYPSGQGANILNFLTEDFSIVKKLELALDKCQFVSDEIRSTIYAGYNERYPESDDMDRFSVILPNFSRDTGSDILKVILYTPSVVHLTDESNFENDDLFCEGVYTINYQTREFITNYGGVEFAFSLDNLPEMSDYLDKADKELQAA